MKTCQVCRAVSPDASKFCGACGRELPEGTANPKSGKSILVPVLIAIGLVGLVLFSISSFGPTGIATPTPEDSIEAAFKMDAYCAADELSAARLFQSFANGDQRAVAGLIQRGKAFEVAKGDGTRKLLSSGPLSYVRITSGAQIGEACWTLGNLLEYAGQSLSSRELEDLTEKNKREVQEMLRKTRKQ